LIKEITGATGAQGFWENPKVKSVITVPQGTNGTNGNDGATGANWCNRSWMVCPREFQGIRWPRYDGTNGNDGATEPTGFQGIRFVNRCYREIKG